MIVATISRKGGVGKTTTSVSLAGALAERCKRVLVIDLDPQASSSRSLNVDRANLAPSIADVLLHNQPVAAVIRATGVPNLDLITASADLNDVEFSLSSSRRPEQLLRNALEPIVDDYDFIVLDCPPCFSLLARNALVASDAHLVPAVPHFLALEGLENLLPAIDRVGRRNGTSSQLLGVLLTMVDYRANLTRENVTAIREHLKDKIMAIEIRTNIRLAEAPQYGKTIFAHAPDSSGAHCYRLLAEETLIRTSQLRATPPSSKSLSHVPPASRPATALTRDSVMERPIAARLPEPANDRPNPLMPSLAEARSEGDSSDLDALDAWLNSSLATH